MSATLPLAADALPAPVIPLAIGLAFGWFLERAGLGSARKLAAQFTLRDFTVVKVMFSAILTAALGLFWLSRLGLLDASRVWIPETRPLAQAVGGIVFGAGFAVAALCPGTSCVAAASGRLDGLAAIAGLLAGTALFVVAYPILAPLHDSPSRGALTIPQALGAADGVVLLGLAAIAMAAFAFAERMERRNQAEAAR